MCMSCRLAFNSSQTFAERSSSRDDSGSRTLLILPWSVSANNEIAGYKTAGAIFAEDATSPNLAPSSFTSLLQHLSFNCFPHYRGRVFKDKDRRCPCSAIWKSKEVSCAPGIQQSQCPLR